MKHFTLACMMATALFGCGKKGDGLEKVISKMTEFKDRACSCKDKACGDGVEQEMSKWMSDVASTGPKGGAEPTDDQKGRLGDIVIQMNACLAKLK